MIIGRTNNNKKTTNDNKYVGSFNNDNIKLQFLNEVQSAEYISMFGVDINYIKIDKENIDINYILGEIKNKTYKDIKFMRVLLRNTTEFGGTGDIFNKIGIAINDEMDFLIDIKTCDQILGRTPMIGDLILHLPSTKLFKIKFVDDEIDESFYNGGKNFMYKLSTVQYKHTPKNKFETENEDLNNLNNIENLNKNNEIIENMLNQNYDDSDNPFN